MDAQDSVVHTATQSAVQVTSAAAAKMSSMKDAFATFSKTLNLAELTSAVDIRMELKKGGIPANNLDVNIDLIEPMRAGFKTFPEIADNEFVVQELQGVEAAQDNLIANPENKDLATKLVDVTHEVAQHLSEQYGDNWQNPFSQ